MLGKKQSEETRRKIGLSNSIALKGRKLTKEHKENIKKAKIGTTNSGSFKKGHISLLKGKELKVNVGIGMIHGRVKNKYGEPSYCEICKRTDKKKYEWSNKKHDYKLPINRDDWQRLCTSCHLKYDIKHNKKNHDYYNRKLNGKEF